MIKNDLWIAQQQFTEPRMIEPFETVLVRENNQKKVISYGLSSYGYDIRLSPKEFRVFKKVAGEVVDPKNFSLEHLEEVPLQEDENGQFFILPAHSYGLGLAHEYLHIPHNVIAICMGKSTYARIGVIANVTPVEPEWKGYLTLEFSNSSDSDCRIYAGEGILQLLFFEGNECATTYADREGKYQSQAQSITFAQA